MNDREDLLVVTVQPGGLALAGEIDASSVGALSERLDPLPPGGGDIVVDFSAVTFIDSSGLRVLIDAHERAARTGRRLVIGSPAAVVRRLLEISGLVGHLHVEPAS